MSTWNFRNFELRRAIFGEFCRLFWGEALFCFVFRVHIADVAGDVFVVIGIGVAVFCGEIFSGISKEFVAGEKRPPCVFHRIRAIRGKKRLPLLCGEILIDEFIVFADAECEAVCAADLPREHAQELVSHYGKQVDGEKQLAAAEALDDVGRGIPELVAAVVKAAGAGLLNVIFFVCGGGLFFDATVFIEQNLAQTVAV